MSEDLFSEVKEKIKEKINAADKSNGVDEIVCIVDRSGSMRSIAADAAGSLNEFISEQTSMGEAYLSIVEFDTDIETPVDRVNINEAEEYVLRPRGMTALLDAIGTVVSNNLKYNAPDGKTIVVIVTDGGENASKEWSRDEVFKLIEERKSEGWEFLFLASNQNAISVGQSYGIAAEESLSFANNADGYAAAVNTASVYTSTLRGGSKADALRAKSFCAANFKAELSETGEVGKEPDSDDSNKS
jgi:Mg-chelatase subunit ChlD